MLWTIVWVVLVVATVVGAFFLGRQLWRQGVALAHEAGRAADVFGALGDLSNEPRATGPFVPGFARSQDDLQQVRLSREARRAACRDRRRARNEAAYARWRAFWSGTGGLRRAR